jgi:SAM-dependent methyltransferase
MSSDTRNLPRTQARTLAAGDAHYSAYVGWPQFYDLMGASQFRLLTTLGLREQHRVLDFGCGSLRLGRLLLPYLLPGNYFGIEPNQWLVEDAVRQEIGAEYLRMRRPRFSHNSDFRVDGFGTTFDMIVAHSVFSHSGRDLIEPALANFRAALAEDGIILATFMHQGTPGFEEEYTGTGWIYPGCVGYAPATILGFIRRAGLVGEWLPWFNQQDWYIMAASRRTLPPKSKHVHLSGAVLRSREFAASS